MRIAGYPEPIRQLVVKDPGHGQLTLLITNQHHVPAVWLIDRYARCMIIENAIDLFHRDMIYS